MSALIALIASEGLPDCVSDGVRHQASAMVTEVSAQKLAHERLAARLELAERRGWSARQQLCALRETLRAAEREVLQRRAAAAAGSTAEAAGTEAEETLRAELDAARAAAHEARRKQHEAEAIAAQARATECH